MTADETYERIVDAAVWRRLERDPRYRYAENAEAQAKAEETITAEVEYDYRDWPQSPFFEGHRGTDLLLSVTRPDPERGPVESYLAETGECELTVTLRSEHPELD